MPDSKPAETIDAYIAACAPDVRPVLESIRATIREVVPDAKERISYRMPAFDRGGIVVYFAAFKQHIGIYPPVRGDAKLEAKLARYRGEKGNLKLPLAEPMPLALIRDVVKARVAAMDGKKAAAKPKPTSKARKVP